MAVACASGREDRLASSDRVEIARRRGRDRARATATVDECPPDQRRADPGEEQAAGQPEPGVEPFGREHRGCGERDAEDDDPGGVGGGDGEADQRRLAERAALPDDVGGHDGLAVSRSQRVEGAQHGGDAHGQECEADGQVVTGDEVGEGPSGAIDAAWEQSRCGGRARRTIGDRRGERRGRCRGRGAKAYGGVTLGKR